MHRHNSKESVGSIESTHGTGKKQMPTHMIIQREDNNELFLLPVTHLVNASVTRIKPNETATFKLDLNSRKQDRGVVLSYGSEDVCTEQMQILSMQSSSDSENFDSHSDPPNGCSENRQNKTTTNRLNKPISSHQKQMHSSSLASKKVTGSCQSVSTEMNETIRMEKSQGLGMTTVNRPKDSNSSLDYASDSVTSRSNSKKVSQSRTTTINQRNRELNNSEPIRRQSSSESQSEIEALDNIDASSVNRCKQKTIGDLSNERDVSHAMENMSPASFDFLSKKCNKLLKENAALQLENDRLRKENHHLQKTTIPMPEMDAREWFINVAKIFSNKSSEMDLFSHAKRLGIKDPKDLISCLQDSTSKTARQIIKLLYSPEQLMTMSGTQIPTAQRQVIRDVAEAHKGPISNHQFNEAINGVFRSKKQEAAKKSSSYGSVQHRTSQQ